MLHIALYILEYITPKYLYFANMGMIAVFVM